MNFNMKRISLAAMAFVVAGSVTFGTVSSSYAHDNGGQSATGMRGGKGHSASLSAIATALNLSETDLRTVLQSGKTVADVATEQGVELATVVDAIVAAETERLNQSVTAGRITQEQADAKIASLKESLPTVLSNPLPAGKGGFGKDGRGGFGHAGSSSTIATALGITETDLHTALQGGQSVADVASEQGVALDTVIDAIVAEQTTAVAQAVTEGRLTQAEADAKLAQLESNLPHLLALKGGMKHGGMGGHRGRGGRHGQLPADANSTPQNQGNRAPALPSETVNA